jgi:flagellar P-ring protein FlgI
MRAGWTIRGLAAGMALALLAGAAQAVRIKDLGRVYGPMETPLTGYGLVVGLSGTGDDVKFLPAVKMLANTFANLSPEARNVAFDMRGAKNVAVVMVSATLPPFSRIGDRITIEVASAGNAKSLAGGRLILCPIGVTMPGYEDIAIASGDVKVSETTPAKGVIEGGAIVQMAVPDELTPNRKITFKLLPQNADYSVATHIVKAIHEDMNIDTEAGQPAVAHAVDAATIEIALSDKQLEDPVRFISRIEQLSVPGLDFDMEARVVIDEKSNTFYAINGNVEISPVVVDYNAILIQIKANQSSTTTTLDDLVATLRQVNATPADVIGILKALESAGALHAKVVRK